MMPKTFNSICILFICYCIFTIRIVHAETFEDLVIDLKSDDYKVSSNARKKLEKISDPKAIDILIELLKDKDRFIRTSAAKGLGNYKEPRVVDSLIKALDDGEYCVRLGAIWSLEHINDPRAVEPVILKLKDESHSVQESAMFALSEFKDCRAIQPLLETMKLESDPEIRSRAEIVAIELLEFCDIDSLAIAMKSENEQIRFSAVRRLEKIKDSKAVDVWIAALESEYPDIRRIAVWSLGKLKDKRATEPLIKILNDKDTEIRESAVHTLGEIGDKRTVDPLIEILNDENPEVRLNAVCALSRICDNRTIEPLLKCLNDQNEKVRMVAIYSLSDMGEPIIGQLLDTLKTTEDKNIRINVIKVLQRIKSDKKIDQLIKLLQNKDSDVKSAAATAIVTIAGIEGLPKDKGIVGLLVENLKDANKDVRKAAAISLGLSHDQLALEPLINSLKDEDPGVRGSIVIALGNIFLSMKDEKNIPTLEPLVSATKDQSESVRRASFMMLGYIMRHFNIKDDVAKESLISGLNDKDEDARLTAAGALVKIGDNRAINFLLDALDSEAHCTNAAAALGYANDKNVVPSLINVIKKETSEGAKYNAINSIKKLTGKDFGEDYFKCYDSCLQWWEENKEEFLKK